MRLTGQQHQQLVDALLDGFDLNSFAQMVRAYLDVRLDKIIASNDNFETVVSKTVGWAEKSDRVNDLIAGAKAANPTNRTIENLPDHFGNGQTPVNTAPAMTLTLDKFQQQRLADLEKHLISNAELLNDYEKLLETETDPRRLKHIQHEIERQKEAIVGYQTQYDELKGSNTIVGGSTPENDAIQAVGDQITELQQQITGMELRLTAQHEQTRSQMSAQQEMILAQIDASRRATVAAVTEKLDQQQLETVELLYDIVDRQQIAQWEAENTANMVRHALVELSKQPSAAQWQQLLGAVDSDAEWQQKLKLTIPIIPMILEYESEVALDVLPALREKWQQLIAKIKR